MKKGKGSPCKGSDPDKGAGKGKNKGKGSPKGKGSFEPGDIVIGASAKNVKILETETHITVGDVTLKLEALAKVCSCGVKEKCWAIAMSVQPWPAKLRLCPCPAKAGHERHDSSHHVFTTQQILQIQKLAGKP